MAKTNDLFKRIKGMYILYFEIILIFRTLGPLILMPSYVDKFFFVSSGLIGIGIIIVDFWHSLRGRNFRKYDIYLLLFLIIMCISSLMNMKYGIFENVKMIMWQSIYFLIIYMFGKEYGREDKIFNYFQIILLVSWFISAIVSLGMFLMQYGIKIPMDNRYYPLRMGFLGNRLFGVFPDPNFGATISVVVILLSIYYLVNKKNISKFFKLFNIANIVVQVIFISLSGSRSGTIVLLTALFVGTFFVIYHKETNILNSLWKKTLFSFAVATILVLIGYYTLEITKELFSHLPTLFYNNVGSDSSKIIGKINLDRPDVTDSGDVSNLRFSLWTSAIEIFKSSWLFGASPMNYLPYAHDILPHTFMGQNMLTAHNFIFLVLATTGITGFVVLFTFLIKSIIKAIKYLFGFRQPLTEIKFYYVLSVMAIAVSALFITELVLVSTIGSVVFWLFLGRINADDYELTEKIK